MHDEAYCDIERSLFASGDRISREAELTAAEADALLASAAGSKRHDMEVVAGAQRSHDGGALRPTARLHG